MIQMEKATRGTSMNIITMQELKPNALVYKPRPLTGTQHGTIRTPTKKARLDDDSESCDESPPPLKRMA